MLNFLVDDITHAITGLFGSNTPSSSELVKEVDNGITQTVKDLAGAAYNTLTKYWYVPVIVGGVIVAYLILRKNPTTKALEAVATIAAAAKN